MNRSLPIIGATILTLGSGILNLYSALGPGGRERIEMLREAAQRRIVAARKKQWAEYRQAKEVALGKPIRRVRANG